MRGKSYLDQSLRVLLFLSNTQIETEVGEELKIATVLSHIL